LEGFGFKGFKIEKKDDISYRLIRADDSEVKETLSEGEHRFITFLYYFQLVKGTLQRDTVNKDKILVIDDPISSLDSNILFIVSFLVRELIKGCLDGSNVKQIIVLTHNIYFHQEIAYKGSRDHSSPLKERFYILRKINEKTTIQFFEKNQINSSYELLWQEIKNPNTSGNIICNTMRRILEHYFNIIGHQDYVKIINEFAGQDRLICKALLSFINTGSHSINDDFHLSVDLDMVDSYKEIFKQIFIKSGQENHYNMMMERC
jgi:wobble nucleotide-excising tRNase